MIKEEIDILHIIAYVNGQQGLLVYNILLLYTSLLSPILWLILSQTPNLHYCSRHAWE